MATTTLEVVIRGRDLLTPTLNKVQRGLTGLGTTATGLRGTILAGVGLGAGVAGFNLLSSAVERSVQVLGDAVRAAIEDEASVRRLTVALSDNDARWRGNTAMVDRFISAAEDLAYTDDQARDSLTKLVAVTGDVARAMELSRTAMDLARLRGIDLATATDMIAKAQAGNIGALRKVLPFIDANATATQALAAIQRVAGGQAAAYAETTSGRLVQSQIALSEALEKLGYAIMPAVGQAADALSTNIRWIERAFNDLAVAIDSLPLPELPGKFDLLSATLENIPFVGAYIKANQYRDAVERAAEASAEARDRIATMKDALDGGASAASGAVAPTDAYSGALGRLWDTADGAWLALRRVHAEMGAGAVPVTVLSNGMIAYGKSASDVQASLNDAVLAQRDWIRSQGSAASASSAASAAMDKQAAAAQRLIDYIKRLDDASRTTFERMISNLDKVIERQLESIDAARQAREDARQQAQDRRDLAAAERALRDASRTGSIDAIRNAQQGLADVRARIEEAQTRKHEDELRRQWEATRDYINAVAQLESSAKNRKALANTLAARQTALEGQRSAALAAGNADLVAMIDAKLAAIGAAITRNEEARRNAEATAKIQQMITVHTVINLDGKTIAEVVDKYLGRN